MKIKIDNNVPIPKCYQSRSIHKEILNKMKVGQSFTFGGEVSRNSLYVSASRLGIKVMIRAEGDHSRIWRVE